MARSAERPVGHHHLAFLRAIVQGIPIDKAAQHYLFGESKHSRPSLRALLRELHARFVKASVLAHKPHLANALPLLRLLRQAQRADQDAQRPLPASTQSFAEFCDAQPEDFYSADELRELYDEYLRERRGLQRASSPTWDVTAALRSIEILTPHLALPPRREHPIEAWLSAPIAVRLRAHGIESVGALIDYINRHGYRWHSEIKGFGRKRAEALARWIRHDAHRAGELTVIATQPRSQLTATDLLAVREGRGAIKPFEALTLPVNLDGFHGINRERQRPPQLQVTNDRDAIEQWLHAGSENINTQRAYRREAERVLQWCVYEKCKPLSSMSVGDCIEYREFLIALGDATLPWHWQIAREDWIGAKSHQRSSPNWRPFEGRMSQKSIERGLTIVRSLFDWLVDAAYLAGNPWKSVKVQLASHERFKHEASSTDVRDLALAKEEWDCLLELADHLEGSERRARAKVIVRLAGQAGLRRDELANVSTGSLKPVMIEDPGSAEKKKRYLLELRGKGGVERKVPMALELDRCLSEYLKLRGLAPLPEQCPPDTPLVAALMSEQREDARLSAGRIYAIVKRLMQVGADSVDEQGRAEQAAHMRSLARTHALRHTFGTTAAEKNSPAVVQAWMGHADVGTTMGYFSPRPLVQFELLDATFKASQL